MLERQNLARYDLVKTASGWELQTGGRTICEFSTKAEALTRGSALERILKKFSGGQGIVRVRSEMRGIEEERTYPRSKDPRASPG
jgi:hypothetical protein